LADSPEEQTPRDNPFAQTLSLLLSMGMDVRGKDPDRAAECFSQAADLARTQSLVSDEIRALVLLGAVRTKKGVLEEAEAALVRARELTQGGGSHLESASVLTGEGQLRLRQGRTDDALRVLRESLAHLHEVSTEGEAGSVRAQTLEQLGAAYREKGDPAQAMRYVQEALELRRAQGDEDGIAYDLNSLGQLHHRMGRNQEAVSYFRDALARWPDGSKRGAAATANNLAATLLRLGELPEAQRYFLESRQLFEELGETRTVATVGTNLGLLAGVQGRLDEAEGHYQESLRLWQQLGDPTGETITLNCLGFLAVERGNPEHALELAESSLAIQKQNGLESYLARTYCCMATAFLELMRFGEARSVAVEASRWADVVDSGEIKALSSGLLAELSLQEGDTEAALAAAKSAVEFAESTDDPRQLADCHRVLGSVYLSRGELEEAKESLARARRALRGWETPYERPRIQMEEGRLLIRAGSVEAAAERFRRAEEGFGRLGNARWQIRALVQLGQSVAKFDPVQSDRCFREAEQMAGAHSLKDHHDALRQSRHEPDPAAVEQIGISPAIEDLGADFVRLQKLGEGDPIVYLQRFESRLRQDFAVAGLRIRFGPRWVPTLTALPRWETVGQGGEFRAEWDEDGGTGRSEKEISSSDSERVEQVVVQKDRAFQDSELRDMQMAATLLCLALEAPVENRRREQSTQVRFVGDRFEYLVGSAPKMKTVYQLISSVSPGETNVLILGESGTGKELAARSIHARSERKDGPFVPINCPSIPKDLIESELFGYEKGAFTGAVAARAGKIEQADGGTLFLDEVGDMALATQSKLLRFLQEREFQRVGGTEHVRVDVRVVAATSRDLGKMMKAGEFREDLYYRLKVVPIEMPPLRERTEDIPTLAEFFLRQARGDRDLPSGFSDSLVEILSRHSWPGNARELRNAIEYMVALCRDDILSESHLPADLRDRLQESPDSAAPVSGERGIGPGETLESRLMQMEAELIRSTLESEGWNQSAAARRLGITETKVRNRMRVYGIRRPPRK